MYMTPKGSRLVALTAHVLLGAGLCLAQNWKTADALPGVDMHELTAAQKATVLDTLRKHDCSCQCGMKVAECRIADPKCSYSTGLSTVMVQNVKAGKTADASWSASADSKYGHLPQQNTKLLEDPVKLTIAGSPVDGNPAASITLVEFSDFQCPYCALAVPELKAVLKSYPSQVKLIFKQFPLENHPQAGFAAMAALAAKGQGKFWPMHDALYSQQGSLTRDSIIAAAREIGLDMERFQKDVDSTEIRETIIRDVQDGDQAGVQGTPTIFINGQRFNGPVSLQALKPVLDQQLKQASANVTAQAGR